jgi:ATP-dependent DNA helicase PIF1
MSDWPVGVSPTPEYEAALDFIQTGEGHLFVTGRAGTGKSTLLRVLCEAAGDSAVVVAPTGLAAINVGGQTIHSFFGLPPRLVQPSDIKRSRNGRIMRQMTTLVIDEISMVRSDLMWAIDQSLRLNRNKPLEPFGGVRLILFGDLHQLPPVIRDAEEAAHLANTHGGPYFFHVGALQAGIGTQLLELSQVFRQTDEMLVRVLDRVREGDVEESDLELLNERVSPIRTLAEGQSFVILTPTNDAANRINRAYLEALPAELKRYEAGVSGEFNPRAQPTDAELMLMLEWE